MSPNSVKLPQHTASARPENATRGVSPLKEVCGSLNELPQVREITGTVLRVTSLSGLTNRVFRLCAENGDFVLRLPREQSPTSIDRHAEAHNHQIAADLGIAQAALFCDRETGVLLMQTIETVQPDRRIEPVKLGALVSRLHRSGARFEGFIDPASLIDGLIRPFALRMCFQEYLSPLVQALHELDGISRGNIVPSHGDLSPGNCLATATGPILIDWEYSAMAERSWDLAYAALENDFSVSEELSFLASYAEQGDDLADLALEVSRAKVRCDAVSAFWAMEQAETANDAADFLAFADVRIERAIATAATLIVRK